MFSGAAVLLFLALIAAAFGYSALAGMSINIAWILFLFGLIFAAVFSLLEQRPRS